MVKNMEGRGYEHINGPEKRSRVQMDLSMNDESGDSSVVTRCTVDQEVVGSNPTHGGNFISVVRSLPWFTQPIR